MNRRGFLGALVAVPLAGLAGAKAPVWTWQEYSGRFVCSAPVRPVRFTALTFHGAEICADMYCPRQTVYLCGEDWAALEQRPSRGRVTRSVAM